MMNKEKILKWRQKAYEYESKDELKQEAKSYAKRKFSEEEQAYLHDIIAQAYYDGAEPREKRIAELKENNLFLNNLVKEKEQRGLEIQEDLLKEKETLEHEKCELLGIIQDKDKALAELKEFYENEYFQISDRTADEKIKELEKHQKEKENG